MDKTLVAKELVRIANMLVRAEEIEEVSDSKTFQQQGMKIFNSAPKVPLSDLKVGDYFYSQNRMYKGAFKLLRITPRGYPSVTTIDENLQPVEKRVLRDALSQDIVIKLTAEELKQAFILDRKIQEALQNETKKRNEHLSEVAKKVTDHALKTGKNEDLLAAYDAQYAAFNKWSLLPHAGGDEKRANEHYNTLQELKKILRAPDRQEALKEILRKQLD